MIKFVITLVVQMWLKSVYKGFLYKYVKYNDYLTFVPSLSFLPLFVGSGAFLTL